MTADHQSRTAPERRAGIRSAWLFVAIMLLGLPARNLLGFPSLTPPVCSAVAPDPSAVVVPHGAGAAAKATAEATGPAHGKSSLPKLSEARGEPKPVRDEDGFRGDVASPSRSPGQGPDIGGMPCRGPPGSPRPPQSPLT